MDSLATMPKYESYKDSGVDWLGEVPQSWEIVPIRGLLNFRNEKNDPVRTEDVLSLSIANGVTQYSEEGRGGNKRKDDLTAYKIARPNDIVMNSMNVIVGAVGVSKFFGAISPVYYALYARNELVSIPYYERIFQDVGFQRGLLRLGKGILIKFGDEGKMNTIRMKISQGDLKTLLFPKPDNKTQIAIADFLNKKTKQIDEAVSIKEKQIALLKERKQIIIQKAVTQGLNPNAPMKDSGVGWIGNIPEHWEVKKFKYLAKVRYGLGQPPNALEGGLKIIRATNVERGKIVEKGMLFVDPSDIPWDRNPELGEGEIIVVRSGAYTGDSALVTAEYAGTIAGYDMVATPFNCYPAFLSNALLSKYVLFDQIYLLRMRSAQPHLNAEELSELLIAVPSHSEQIEISNYLSKVDDMFEITTSQISRQIANLKEYKSTLINSAVTGKIKVA